MAIRGNRVLINNALQIRDTSSREARDMTDLDPEPFTLRQAAQARDDFAQVMVELDLGEAVRPLQPGPTPSIERCPKPVTQNTRANAALPASRMPTTTLPCQRRSSGSVSAVISVQRHEGGRLSIAHSCAAG